jgi:3-deoxy-manno-octulosonate cytidylyltransferase (CMP-KDO synthetase)
VPLVVRVWQRVTEIGVADRVVVATDSEEVAQAAREHGAGVVMTRTSHRSGTDRVAEVAARPEFLDFGVIINVQGDEPFVSAQAVAGAAHLVSDSRFALGTAAVLAPRDVLDDPHVVKVVADDLGRAMYFSRAPIPFLQNDRDAETQRAHVWQHIGVYAYTADALRRWVALPVNPLEQIERLEQLRPMAAGMAMGVALVDEPVRPGIDTEQELERANEQWTAFTTG